MEDILTEQKIYQICIQGEYKNFDGKGRYNSKKVYINTPSKDEIDKFIVRCCHSDSKKDLMDLDESTIKISILELELNK